MKALLMKFWNPFRIPTPQDLAAHQLAELEREYLNLMIKMELSEAQVISYKAEAQARLNGIERLKKNA